MGLRTGKSELVGKLVAKVASKRNSARESGRTSVKLPYALAGAMASTILAMVLLAAPARAQTYDPSYPVCLQIYQSMVDYYFECRYTSMAQCAASASGPLGPVRGQSVLRQAVGQAQQAPEAVQQLLKVRPRAHRPLQRLNCGHVRSAPSKADEAISGVVSNSLTRTRLWTRSSVPLMLTLFRTGSLRPHERCGRLGRPGSCQSCVGCQ